MNKYFKYYTTGLFVLGLALFNSCKDENELTTGFSIDKEEITMGENGGMETIQVSGDAKWQTTIDATWVRVLPSNGVGSTLCEVKVDSSVVAEPRYAEIQYMAEGGTTKTVKITQTGYMKGVFVENADQEIVIENSGEYGKRYYDLKVTANIEFYVDVSFEGGAEWLKYNKRDINYDYGDRPRTFNLRFDWLTNVQESERTATVTITPKGDDANVADPLVLKFRQKSAPKITDNRAGDSLAILAIYESMNGIFEWDASENMMYWEGVELWKATDPEVKKNDKLLGRLKSVKFRLFETYESIPYQIKHLWTAKSISFSGNSNIFLKSIKLGPEICELAGEGKMLKELTISAYGLVELPDGFDEFGKNLEMLDLSSNNFEYKDEVTFNKNSLGVINSDNFKKLKRLRLNKITRYDTTRDLSLVEKTDSVGFRWKTGFGTFTNEPTQVTNDKYFKMLLQWENLEELSLSLNLLEGELPSDEDLLELGIPKYSEEFLKTMPYYKDGVNDTIKLADANIYLLKDGGAPKVWPKMKSLSLNLNFLTGKLPKWILYHPYLTYWNPFSMIFTQETDAINTDKKKAGFDNEPTNLSNYSNTGYTEGSYYYVYPGRKPKNEDSNSTEE